MSPTPSPHLVVRLIELVTGARRPWQIVLLALAAIVFFLAVMPHPPKQVDLGWDKLNHASAFAALAFSGYFAFPGSRRTLWAVMLGVFALGGLIEIVQYFVPGRSCDWFDLAADAVGIACGTSLALALRALTRRAAEALA